MAATNRHPDWCDPGWCQAYANPDTTVAGWQPVAWQHSSAPWRVAAPERFGYPVIELFLRLDARDPITNKPAIFMRLARTDYPSIEGYELDVNQVLDLHDCLPEVLAAREANDHGEGR